MASVPSTGDRPLSDEHAALIHKRLRVNAISNASRYVFFVAVTLFITPYLVRTLGTAYYGVWILIISFTGYAGVLEFGIQSAVVKFVAEYRAQGESEKLRALVATAFLFLTAMGFIAALTLLLALPHFFEALVADSKDAGFSNTLYMILAVDVAVLLPSYAFASVVYGFQLYYLKNLFDMLAMLAQTILIVAFLRPGDLFTLAVIKMSVDIATGLIGFALCKRVFPAFSLTPRLANWESVRELLKFGSMIFASATVTRIATHSQPILIGYFLSPMWTAFFSIPDRMIGYAREISWSLATGFMPVFSELSGNNNTRMLYDVYVTYTKYIVMCSLPIVAVVFALGNEFITLWIAPEYGEKGKIVLYLLSAGYALSLIQPLILRLFTGIGKPQVVFRVSTFAAALTLTSTLLLVKPYGINGVAGSALIGVLISQVLFLRYTRMFLGIEIGNFVVTAYLRPLLAAAGFYLTLLAFGVLLGTGSYLTLFAVVLLSLPFYILPAYYVILAEKERSEVGGRLRTFIRWR